MQVTLCRAYVFLVRYDFEWRTQKRKEKTRERRKDQQMTTVSVVSGDWKTYQHECERVRAMVFIAEQKVPREMEFDEDDHTAEHFVAIDSRKMVMGCARLLDDGRIGRVAVLRPFRRRGMGRTIMEAVLERAKARGMTSVYLGAQVQAQPFYEGLGFEPYCDIFDEAGIPHQMMRKAL